MIITHFQNLRDFRRSSAVVDMPHPVRVGEDVEINGECMTVVSTSWVIESGSPTILVARMR
ncbi:hypothetical protein CAPNMURICA_76 [Arthrobacter phage CapnMurica]|uniref:Uncharacterized protein n=1 Tax=Arthrobacter phage CapnMurica TaxID=1772294 RepID=A0A0U4JFN9_9CAUD|nr:hypothetical protein FDH68_gp76 [Arthrobacter phage CaptnMurica]ALY08676.1 hypothetical protein CAPNMURICA_76 [Arthrobacter phage CaptnMurica]